LLRALGSARVRTFTTDASNSSARFSEMAFGFCGESCARTGRAARTAQKNSQTRDEFGKCFISASCGKGGLETILYPVGAQHK
jgi:hypothetical protein